MCRVVVRKDALEYQLRASVWVRRIGGVALRYRHCRRIAVHGGTRREHNVGNVRPHKRIEQAQAAGGELLMPAMDVPGVGRMATIADVAGQTTMWGCMIESAVGLSAALHIALACPNTRFLDLDGSYDLVEDIVDGGIHIENGVLHTLDRPGLGVTLRD